MGEQMTFPKTFDEFAEQYKIVDKEQVYTNGTELIPIFRVKQWLGHIPTADVAEVKHGEWIEDGYADIPCVCSYCGEEAQYISKFNETFDYDWEENLQSTGYEEIREYIRTPYCPNCGAKMDGKKEGTT